jgi:hypothetical protein
MKRLFVCCLLLALAGCAGNGKGLDENGNPIGNGGGGQDLAFDPTFTNIKQNVFTPICTRCHVGATAPRGLNLSSETAYTLLVNVTSSERPQYMRVQPGNPNDSYIVRKLEGGPDIAGGQMPLNLPPLDQRTINSIRAWIARGARND